MSHGDRTGPESAEGSRGPSHSSSESRFTSTLATVESSRPESSSQAPSNSETSREENPAAENGRNRILKDLEEVAESFRNGKSTKTEAISGILRVLREDTNVSLTQPQREAAFDSYLTEFLSIQSHLDEAGGAGPAESSPITGQESSLSAVPIPTSRKAREAPESESDDDEDKPHKKQRLLESDMPWYTGSGDSSTGYSDPSCEETCRLLRAYNRDISKAKFFVKIAPKSPPGIPSSQWERILKGEAVDLNQIFASLHHVVPDEERTGRLGDTEITFGVAEPRKRITTAAEWSAAWRRASKAIGFAFPHRRDELFEYGDYIESEFAAKVTSSHHKLLLYDIALRNEVAAGQHSLLTDHNRFSRLYSATSGKTPSADLKI